MSSLANRLHKIQMPASETRPDLTPVSQLRPRSHRPNISAHVGQRARMDHVVCPEVLGVLQSRASHFPSIRRTGSGTSGALRNSGAGDQPQGHREGDEHPRHVGHQSDSCPSAQGQSQESGSDPLIDQCGTTGKTQNCSKF